MKPAMGQYALILRLLLPGFLGAQSLHVLTNHIGYEATRAKHAVVMADDKQNLNAFYLIDDSTGRVVYTANPVYTGPVDHWKNRRFWTIDFSAYKNPGVYRLRV